MAVWIRLAIAALVIIGAIVGIRSLGNAPILIEDVQASSHGGALVGVTLTIRNTGAPDRLISVDAPGTKMAILKGENAQPLPIPGNATVSLAMDGAHVMLGGVPGSLEDGTLIPLVLSFEHAGKLAAKARFGKPMMMEGAMDHSAMMAMEYDVPADEPAPTISVTTTPRDDGGYDVAITTTDFEFSQDQADGPHAPGVGHGHLYAGGVKIGRVYSNTATIPPLPTGEHIIRVNLNTNDHRKYYVDDQPVTAAVTVNVE